MIDKILKDKVEESIINITSNDIGKSFREIFPDELFEKEFVSKLIEEKGDGRYLTEAGKLLFYKLWCKIFSNVKMEGDIKFHFHFEITNASIEALNCKIKGDICEIDRVIIDSFLDKFETEISISAA